MLWQTVHLHGFEEEGDEVETYEVADSIDPIDLEEATVGPRVVVDSVSRLYMRTERMCPVAEVFAASGGWDEELDWLTFEECMPTFEEEHAWAKPVKNFR